MSDKLKIRERLDCLPNKPGVYLLKDKKGKALYIGKALSLKKRVRSYFFGKTHSSPRISSLVNEIKDIEWMITDSETEALILESNLIKYHHPHYNIQFRDDKSYPYIKLTISELFPRLLLTRNPRKDGSLYFGPYTNVKAARRVLILISRFFPLRRCKKRFTFRIRPCLNYYIKECHAPCMKKITREAYSSLVRSVSLFLQGHYQDLLRRLQEEMEEASLKEEFEKAATLRDCIRDIHRVSQSQKMVSFPGEDIDLVNIVSEQENACVVVFLIREGKVIDRKHFLLDIREKSQKEDIITFFLKEYYARISFVPARILIPNEIAELKVIQEWLSERRGKKVKLEIPKKGNRLKLMQLIKKNAYLILQQERRGDKEQALDQLKGYLELKKKPLLIEGFDVSNTRGKEATGSVVVFEKGKPKKSAYRRFKIKEVEGIDDFAMLSEVIRRRYHRSLKEGRALPHLILVDGGKGQVSSCLKAIKQLDLNFIPVIGLAKEFEEVYCPDSSFPLNIPSDSIALKLLQEIRDEAHRFAYSYHKKKRGEKIRGSFLDTIPGVGEKTKRLLLTHFKSIELIKSQDLEALQQIPGIGKKRAKKILRYLVNRRS